MTMTPRPRSAARSAAFVVASAGDDDVALVAGAMAAGATPVVWQAGAPAGAPPSDGPLGTPWRARAPRGAQTSSAAAAAAGRPPTESAAARRAGARVRVARAPLPIAFSRGFVGLVQPLRVALPASIEKYWHQHVSAALTYSERASACAPRGGRAPRPRQPHRTAPSSRRSTWTRAPTRRCRPTCNSSTRCSRPRRTAATRARSGAGRTLRGRAARARTAERCATRPRAPGRPAARRRRRRRRRVGRRALRVDSKPAARGRRRAAAAAAARAPSTRAPRRRRRRLAAGVRAESDAYNGLWKADAFWASLDGGAAELGGARGAQGARVAGRRARARALRRALPRLDHVGAPWCVGGVSARGTDMRNGLYIAPAERLERQRATIGAAPVLPERCRVGNGGFSLRDVSAARARAGRGRGAGPRRGGGRRRAPLASALGARGHERGRLLLVHGLHGERDAPRRARRAETPVPAARRRRGLRRRGALPGPRSRGRSRSSPRTAARPGRAPRRAAAAPPVRAAQAVGLQPRYARVRGGGESCLRISRRAAAAGVRAAAEATRAASRRRRCGDIYEGVDASERERPRPIGRACPPRRQQPPQTRTAPPSSHKPPSRYVAPFNSEVVTQRHDRLVSLKGRAQSGVTENDFPALFSILGLVRIPLSD